MIIAPDERDGINATLTHWRSTPRWLGTAALAAFAVCLAEGLRAIGAAPPALPALRNASLSALLIAMLLGVAALTVRFLYMPWRARTLYRRQTRRPYTLTFDEIGLNWKSDTGDGSNPWSNFTAWREGRRVFLLYRTRTRFQIVPKQAFGEPEDIDAFRASLDRKISQAGWLSVLDRRR